MNKSDKYYLKKGKLELSMLDEEEDEYLGESIRSDEQKDVYKNLEFEHTKKLRQVRKKTQQEPQQTLKVSKDIYNTLHTMGQFLTKMEPQIVSVPAKKNMNSAKVQKLEQIASSIKVQEIELPPTIIKENRFSSLNISKSDQIKEINEVVNIPSVESKQVDTEVIQIDAIEAFSDTRRIDRAELEAVAINLDYRSQGVEEELRIRPIDADENLNMLINKSEGSTTLDQNSIDNILAPFFKTKEPQYTFSRELKNHIDKHIIAIKNYK